MTSETIQAPGPGVTYRWRLLIPSHRYIFAVEDGGVTEFNRTGDMSFHRFRRYQDLKADHPVHGMIAWPNTLLLQGPATVVVDPGLRMQGPPLVLALRAAGLGPSDVDLVVNTHAHDDHVQGNAYFEEGTIAVHELELASAGPPSVDSISGRDGGAAVRLLSGEEGELAPGLRFLRTPGHTDGSICVVADTEDGRLVVAGDTVGPLPVYFTDMYLPDGFPEKDRLLASWQRIRDLEPAVVIPGHNPPIRMSWHSTGKSANN